MLAAGVSWVTRAWSGGDGPAVEGLLDQGDAAGGCVVTGADEGPDALGEGGAGGDVDLWVAAVGEVEGEVAIGSDDEGEAVRGGVVGPACD